MVHKQTEFLYGSEKQRATETLPYSLSLSFLFSFISPPLLSSLLKSKTTAFAWTSWCVMFVCVFTPMLSLVVAGNQKCTKPFPYPFGFDTHAGAFLFGLFTTESFFGWSSKATLSAKDVRDEK